jgi:hypothetical protein
MLHKHTEGTITVCPVLPFLKTDKQYENMISTADWKTNHKQHHSAEVTYLVNNDCTTLVHIHTGSVKEFCGW